MIDNPKQITGMKKDTVLKKQCRVNKYCLCMNREGNSYGSTVYYFAKTTGVLELLLVCPCVDFFFFKCNQMFDSF